MIKMGHLDRNVEGEGMAGATFDATKDLEALLVPAEHVTEDSAEDYNQEAVGEEVDPRVSRRYVLLNDSTEHYYSE